MTDWNDEDEYEYRDTPSSQCDGLIDEEAEDVRDLMEWGENVGLSKLMTTREGANFVRIGNLWLVPLMGGQPIHHDRHILFEEDGSIHTWNIVCHGEGDQMLVTEVSRDIFNHIPLKRGAMVYLNTLNRHLVSRNEGKEICVLIQHTFPERPDPEEALATIIREWRRVTSPAFDQDPISS